jgi:hypothetical protein
MLPELFRVRHGMDGCLKTGPIKFLAPQMPCRELKLRPETCRFHADRRPSSLIFNKLNELVESAFRQFFPEEGTGVGRTFIRCPSVGPSVGSASVEKLRN